MYFEDSMSHIPVLLQESIALLNLSPGDLVVDCTYGQGGHATELMKQVGQSGRYIGIDADPISIQKGREIEAGRKTPVELIVGNFRDLDTLLTTAKVREGSVHGFLFDLGVNSEQIGPSGRGFSFQYDEPLRMTFGNTETGNVTASEVVNEWSEESLDLILRGFGGEQFSRQIASGIISARKQKQIESTRELVHIIEKSVPVFYRHRRLHPATKTFQAIRMAVNDELGALKAALPKAWSYVSKKGRIAVISFHEGEDRIVKEGWKELRIQGGRIITRKPCTVSRAERRANPRSRSAKLRVIEK